MLDLDLKRCPIDERCGVIGIQQIAELCRAARRLREVARDAVAGHAQRNGPLPGGCSSDRSFQSLS